MNKIDILNRQNAIIETTVVTYGASVERFLDLIILTYLDNKKRPCFKILTEGSSKLAANYYCASEHSRTLSIEEYKKQAEARRRYTLERKIEKSLFVHAVKVGFIFYSSWGYEQTNVDFYQVIEVKGAFVIIRQIEQVTTEKGFMSGDTTPIKDNFKGEAIRKKVLQYNRLRISSFKSASLWDGSPVSCSWYA